jgi:hypothetical protein
MRHTLRDRVWWAAFLLFFGLGLTWALASPLLSNPDEAAHSIKAAALVRGQVFPPKVNLPNDGPNSLLQGGWSTSVSVPASFTGQMAGIPGCYINHPDIPAGCAPRFVDDPRPSHFTTLIGRYPPTYYAIVGAATLVSTGARGIYGMRFITAALSALLLATAFACAREVPRFRLLALGVLVACSPEVLILSGSVNPNSLEASSGICTWALLGVATLHDAPKIPKRLLVLIGISASLLVWTRPLSSLWLALIVLTVLVFLGNRTRLRQRLRERGVQVLIAVLAVVGLGAGVWTLVSNDLGNNSGYYPKGLGVWQAAIHSLGLTPSYLSQMVAVFGWWRTPAFPVISWVWGLALGILVVVALWRSRPRLAFGILTIIAIVLLVPTALQAPTAKTLGFVWSGRYGLAIGAGVPILAALALCSSGRIRQRTTKWLVGVVVTLVAIVQVAAHYANMRRYITGDKGALWYFRHNGWIPPLPAWSLLLSMVLLSTGLAILTYRVATSRAVTTDGDPAAALPPGSSDELAANGRGRREPVDASVKAR